MSRAYSETIERVGGASQTQRPIWTFFSQTVQMIQHILYLRHRLPKLKRQKVKDLHPSLTKANHNEIILRFLQKNINNGLTIHSVILYYILQKMQERLPSSFSLFPSVLNPFFFITLGNFQCGNRWYRYYLIVFA